MLLFFLVAIRVNIKLWNISGTHAKYANWSCCLGKGKHMWIFSSFSH